MGYQEIYIKNLNLKPLSWPPCTFRIKDLVQYMAPRMPNTHIVVVGILPRGEFVEGKQFSWPNMYRPAIQAINGQLSGYGSGSHLGSGTGTVTYLSCGDRFIQSGSTFSTVFPKSTRAQRQDTRSPSPVNNQTLYLGESLNKFWFSRWIIPWW